PRAFPSSPTRRSSDLSTTTDIIPIVGGRVVAEGCTDTSRLRSGELVYTGCSRTPVSAIVRWVPLDSGRGRVAAEHFSVAAGVFPGRQEHPPQPPPPPN